MRWYPPEYFKNNYYSFKGDVWAFGIVLWEMQMFGESRSRLVKVTELIHLDYGRYKNTNVRAEPRTHLNRQKNILHFSHVRVEPHLNVLISATQAFNFPVKSQNNLRVRSLRPLELILMT